MYKKCINNEIKKIQLHVDTTKWMAIFPKASLCVETFANRFYDSPHFLCNGTCAEDLFEMGKKSGKINIYK